MPVPMQPHVPDALRAATFNRTTLESGDELRKIKKVAEFRLIKSNVKERRK